MSTITTSVGYRALIVEDEAPSRHYLFSLLSIYPFIEVVGAAADLREAAELCLRHRPNLLFLDVQLGSRDGFDLLAGLDYSPHVIFVTGRTDFAIRAFEVQAVDYLMKPVFQNRLEVALRRLPGLEGESKLALPVVSEIGPATTSAATSGEAIISSLFLTTESGTEHVSVDRLCVIRASGNYSQVYVSGWRKPALLYRGIIQWTEILPAHPFVRINRSVIVNVATIESVRYLSPVAADLGIAGYEGTIRIGRGAIKRLKPFLK